MFNFAPNILKNIATGPATRQYPSARRELPEGVRGELYNEIDTCIFCGICSRKCPSLCITVDKKQGTWTCDPFMCVYCGICADACPTHCLHFHKTHRPAATQRQMIAMQGTPKPPKAKKKSDTE